MTLKSNNSDAAGNKSIFTLFSLKSLSGMYGVFFVSGFVDNVCWVFTLRQTLHPFIYCFNIPLIYRFIEEFRISTEKKQKTGKHRK